MTPCVNTDQTITILQGRPPAAGMRLLSRRSLGVPPLFVPATALVSSSSVVREESHEAQAWIDRCCGCCAAWGGADGVHGLAGRRSGRSGRGIVSPLQFLLPSGTGGQDRP